MARLGSVLAQIVSLVSFTVACSDGDGRGTCYGNPAPRIYLVPIIVGGDGGSGGSDSGAAGAGGARDPDCSAYCAPGEACEVIDSGGELSAQCTAWPQSDPFPCPPPGVAIGRRPGGMLAAQVGGKHETELGAFFANVAHLEAASIHAFVQLGHELRIHGAGDALLRLTRKAARDEVRHAFQMSRLAKRYGARVPRPRLQRLRLHARSLLDLARENEIEGCVRETFGAMVALWQAEHAATVELRAVFAQIAHDEIAHAELAWQLRSWLCARFGGQERAELDAVQRTAVAALRGELASEPPVAWRKVAGVPDATTASRMLSLLVEQLRTAPEPKAHHWMGF
jgi:hypothetical protein